MRSAKKWSFVVIALSLLVAISVACSGNGESGADEPTDSGDSGGEDNGEETVEVYDNGLPKDEEVTLNYGFWEAGHGRVFIDHAMETFTEKYPNVTFDVTYSPKIGELISTKLKAGDDEDMFDLFTPNFASGSDKQAAAEQGLLEPLGDLLDREAPHSPGMTIREIYTEGVLETREKIDGKTYHLPGGGYTAGLFFDINLFEEHGWNQNPRTWDEFVELLEDIKSEGIIPITFPGQYPDYINNAFGDKHFELAEANGNLEEYEATFRNYELPYYTAPEFQEVWQRIHELGKNGYFPEGLAALSHTQSQMQMLQHKAAMVATGDWVENEMKDAQPDGFEWGFMLVPITNDPDATVWMRSSLSGGGASSIYIWANKPDLIKDWAKEFVIWMLSPEVQAFNAEHAGIYPIRKDFAEDPEMVERMQDAPRAVIQYMNEHNVRSENNRREVQFSHPASTQAGKTLSEAITEIALGNQDPIPILEKAEEYFTEAVEAYQEEQE